jgi:hypothetical protein
MMPAASILRIRLLPSAIYTAAVSADAHVEEFIEFIELRPGRWATVTGEPVRAVPRHRGDDARRIDSADPVTPAFSDVKAAVTTDRETSRIVQISLSGRSVVTKEGAPTDSGDRRDLAVGGHLALVHPTNPVVAGVDDYIDAKPAAIDTSSLDHRRSTRVARAQVQSQDLYAAPSITATLSTLPGGDVLRRLAPTLGPAGADLTAALPVPEQLPDRHENNGTVLRAPGSGYGKLAVENGTDHDTAVTLSQDGRDVGSFYVARSATAQTTNVPNGTYDIFFTLLVYPLHPRWELMH